MMHPIMNRRWRGAGLGPVAACLLCLTQLGGSAVGPTTTNAASAPGLSDLQRNWPRFRGWDGSGVSLQSNIGFQILWQAAIPAPGHSSPIVWGDRVFISGGTAARREVFCYAAANGALLWRRAVENVPGSPAEVPVVPEDTTYAASTMATDGRRVYAIFANGDLGALTLDGAVVWTKYLGPWKNPYGYAASLAVWQNNLIVQLDQGDPEPAGSKLIALDGAGGGLVWERNRPTPASWATPMLVEAGGKTQVITLGNPWVIAYAPADGEELWRAHLLDGDVVPSAGWAGGLVLVINPGSTLTAVRPDGAGDVTKTKVAWSTDENVPEITSPVGNAELVFMVSGTGVVTCLQAGDGKKIWEKNLDLDVRASPSIAGGRLLLADGTGVLVTLEAGRVFHELARSRLPDKFLASPAFAGGADFFAGGDEFVLPGGGWEIELTVERRVWPQMDTDLHSFGLEGKTDMGKGRLDFLGFSERLGSE